MLDAIIFDSEGVIVDSFPDQYKWFRVVSSEFGVEFPYNSIAVFKQNYSAPVIPNMYEKLGINFYENADKINQMFAEFGKENIAPLFDSMKSGLIHLKKSGIKLGIATTHARAAIKTIYDHHGIYDLFDAIVTKDDVANDILGRPKTKPHPDALLNCIEELKVNAEDIIYVGDQTIDIACAKNAEQILMKSIDTIAVTYGYGTNLEMTEAELIHSPQELMQRLMQRRPKDVTEIERRLLEIMHQELAGVEYDKAEARAYLNCHRVGVQGDAQTYFPPVEICVQKDGRNITDHEVLAKISNRAANEIPRVNTVLVRLK